MQLQENQNDHADTTENTARTDTTRQDETLILRKDRVIFLEPREFVTDVQTIRMNGLVAYSNTG
jgi:hypothetical protein